MLKKPDTPDLNSKTVQFKESPLIETNLKKTYLTHERVNHELRFATLDGTNLSSSSFAKNSFHSSLFI